MPFIGMYRMAVVVAAVLAISACDKTTTGGGIDVAEVQKQSVQVCKYEPTFQTVTDIFNSGSPLLKSVKDIAAAVCGAVNTPRSAGQPATVNGVVVQGKRV